MGTNDFRSTKDALLSYLLCAQPNRVECVSLIANGTSNGERGTLSARAWLNGSNVRVLAATLSNEGGNSFTQAIAVLPHLHVQAKTAVTGAVQLRVQ